MTHDEDQIITRLEGLAIDAGDAADHAARVHLWAEAGAAHRRQADHLEEAADLYRALGHLDRAAHLLSAAGFARAAATACDGEAAAAAQVAPF